MIVELLSVPAVSSCGPPSPHARTALGDAWAHLPGAGRVAVALALACASGHVLLAGMSCIESVARCAAGRPGHGQGGWARSAWRSRAVAAPAGRARHGGPCVHPTPVHGIRSKKLIAGTQERSPYLYNSARSGAVNSMHHHRRPTVSGVERTADCSPSPRLARPARPWKSRPRLSPAHAAPGGQAKQLDVIGLRQAALICRDTRVQAVWGGGFRRLRLSTCVRRARMRWARLPQPCTHPGSRPRTPA